MASSKFDKQIDNAIAEGIKYIGQFFKTIWLGGKKLKNPKSIIGLLVSVFISAAAFMLNERIFEAFSRMEMSGFIQKLMYIVILSAPLLYLAILGHMTNKKLEEYRKKFESIGFRGKTGYPIYISDEKDDIGRVTYVFKSDISLGEWKRAKEALETALDCTIWEITNKGSKKIIQIVAMPSGYELPVMVPWENHYVSEKDGELVLGEAIEKTVKFNLNSSPHALIAGTTGSGKSVILRCCVWQMIQKGAIIKMFDFKGGVEFGIEYERFGEVITERDRAIEVLAELVEENKKRLALFRKMGVKNLAEYNQRTGKNLARIIVASDEVAEMLDKTGSSKEEKEQIDEIQGYLSTLARLARATGINLLLGTQRPDANVVSGQIKNNLPIRICGRFSDRTPSEIVLNNSAATTLPSTKGRFLFQEGNEQLEFQAFFYKDEEVMSTEVNVRPGTMLLHAERDYYTDDSAYQSGYAYEERYESEPNKKQEPQIKSPEDMMNFDYSDVFDDGNITWSVNE